MFSLLSTAGPLAEAAFYERIATLFTGHDLPDEGLVRACLDSYRSPSSTPDRLATTDDLLRRSHEHTDLLATLADAGHRNGMRVWLARKEQMRRSDGALLGDRLTDRESRAYLGAVSRSAELGDVDCVWYIRGKVALLFEVEWTAMLGEPLLRRHARILPDPNLIRFLVIAPERTELVRYKLGRSPLLRNAIEVGGFHIIKSHLLRGWLAAEHPGPRRPGAAHRARSGRRAIGRTDAAVRGLTLRGSRRYPVGNGGLRPRPGDHTPQEAAT